MDLKFIYLKMITTSATRSSSSSYYVTLNLKTIRFVYRVLGNRREKVFDLCSNRRWCWRCNKRATTSRPSDTKVTPPSTRCAMNHWIEFFLSFLYSCLFVCLLCVCVCDGGSRCRVVDRRQKRKKNRHICSILCVGAIGAINVSFYISKRTDTMEHAFPLYIRSNTSDSFSAAGSWFSLFPFLS
jgi:hypothetical protein